MTVPGLASPPVTVRSQLERVRQSTETNLILLAYSRSARLNDHDADGSERMSLLSVVRNHDRHPVAHNCPRKEIISNGMTA